MLDRYPDVVIDEAVAKDGGAEAVAAPDPVFASLDVVADESVAAESRLDPVRVGEAEVVAVEKIVVGTANTRVHRALPGPEKQSVATVSHRVVGDDVLVALLVHQKIGGILPAPVESFAISAHIVVARLCMMVLLLDL